MVAFGRDIKAELADRAPTHVRTQTCNSLGRGALFKKPWSDADVTDERDHDLIRGIEKRLKPTQEEHDQDPTGADTRAVAAGGWPRKFDPMEYVSKAVALGKANLVGSRAELTEIVRDLNPPDELVDSIAAAAAEVMKAAIDDKKRMSFDDQIWLPVVMGYRPKQYDCVLVDEAQDITPAQLKLLLSALRQGGVLIAVGDPLQAIFAWRGAASDGMSRIATTLGAPVLPLATTYRCARTIVALTNTYGAPLRPAPGAKEGMLAQVNRGAMLTQLKAGDYVLSRLNAPLVSRRVFPVAMSKTQRCDIR